jgi:hypothetical protein
MDFFRRSVSDAGRCVGQNATKRIPPDRDTPYPSFLVASPRRLEIFGLACNQARPR